MAFATIILCLAVAVSVLVNLLKNDKRSKSSQFAPGPNPWPILGNLFYIGKFGDIIEAFSHAQKEYGNMVSLKLGVFDAVVVSGWKNFRDVLVNQANKFDARPNFQRFGMLFGGSRNNSLAFCDGSASHKTHRSAISAHTFMKNGTITFDNLQNATTDKLFGFMEQLKTEIGNNNKFDVRPLVAESLAAIFVKFYCNIEADTSDPLFKKMVDAFEGVFQEINQDCVGDVLPYLMRFINKKHCEEYSHTVREFVQKRIVTQTNRKLPGIEQCSMDENNNEKEMSEKQSNVWNSLLDMTEHGESLDQVLYAFEDLLGGHSAISNTFVRILYFIAQHPQVQQQIREEVNEKTAGFPDISDRLTYTEAAVWEAIRFISSPIVPHVATDDVMIDGHVVSKGTIVMFNNHGLNFSPELWTSPDAFMPERFIGSSGNISKPEFFLPFSTGKRSCLGYKLAIHLSRVLLANICQNFSIDLDPEVTYNFPRGVIAVGPKQFPFIFKPVL